MSRTQAIPARREEIAALFIDRLEAVYAAMLAEYQIPTGDIDPLEAYRIERYRIERAEAELATHVAAWINATLTMREEGETE
jgi:hypothetical protein